MKELAEKFDSMCKEHVGSRSDEKKKGRLAYWDDQLHQAVKRLKASKTGANACDVVIAFDKMFKEFSDTDFMAEQEDVLVRVDKLIEWGEGAEADAHRYVKGILKELRRELKRCLRP
jgi:hypothetical protein